MEMFQDSRHDAAVFARADNRRQSRLSAAPTTNMVPVNDLRHRKAVVPNTKYCLLIRPQLIGGIAGPPQP
jgi:hypothetical protein